MEQKHFKKAIKMISQAGVHLFDFRCLQQLKCDTDYRHSQEYQEPHTSCPHIMHFVSCMKGELFEVPIYTKQVFAGKREIKMKIDSILFSVLALIYQLVHSNIWKAFLFKVRRHLVMISSRSLQRHLAPWFLSQRNTGDEKTNMDSPEQDHY